MEPKSIRYSIMHKDVLAFNLRALLRNWGIRITFLLLIGYVVYTGLNFQMPADQPQPSTAARIIVTILIVCAATVFLALALMASMFLMIWTKRFKGVIGEHELTLTDTGMKSKSVTGEATRNWNALFRIASTPSYLFLYVNETSALIVPKRYFTSPDEARSFEQTIRERAKTD